MEIFNKNASNQLCRKLAKIERDRISTGAINIAVKPEILFGGMGTGKTRFIYKKIGTARLAVIQAFCTKPDDIYSQLANVVYQIGREFNDEKSFSGEDYIVIEGYDCSDKKFNNFLKNFGFAGIKIFITSLQKPDFKKLDESFLIYETGYPEFGHMQHTKNGIGEKDMIINKEQQRPANV